jgi:hypothetical protein
VMDSLIPEGGPRRVLALATALAMTGYGIYLTASVLYFTRAMGLAPSRVGIGLTVAGAVALATGVPAGHLADRRGSRGVYAITLATAAASMTGLCLTRGFWPFLLFASVAAIAQSTGPAARGPLVKHYGGERPAEFRAYLRAVTNIGIAVGAVLAGFGIQAGTRAAYLVLLAGSAVCSAAAAGVVLLLPTLPAEPASPGRRWIALRDRPYLALTVLDGVMAIQFRVLTAALPLWLLSRTHAPRWSVSAVMLVNTAIVVLFQVRASRSIDNPRAGGVAFRRSGFAFLASCAVFSTLSGAPSWLVVALVLAGVVVHTVGEIWQSAGGFELSFALAPSSAVGQYQGLFGMGLGLGITIGPALLIGLCIDWGAPGWWVVGAMFAATGSAVPAVVAWSERRSAVDAGAEVHAEVAT